MEKNPMHMDPREIVEEISQLGKQAEQVSKRLYELSDGLHRQMRLMSELNQNRGIYRTYSSAWMRFSGMVHQGLQRNRSTERLLGLLSESEKDAFPEHRGPGEKDEPRQPSSFPTSVDDFTLLYGDGSLNYAAPTR